VHTKTNLWLLLVGGPILFAIGCQEDEIRHYQAPKPEKISLGPSAERPKIRLLGAIFQRGAAAWVFKLSGPESAIAKQEEAFDQLIQTVRFKDDAGSPITWATPDAWKTELSKGGLRYATIRPDAKDGPLEITVSQLMGEKAGSVADNVKRWCGQLSLSEPTPAELLKYCTAIKVDNVDVTVVKMTGIGSSASKGPMAPPPFVKGPPPDARPPARAPLKYTIPPGWTQMPNTQFSVASFTVGDGDRLAKITTTPLFGAAGGLNANVNRWRGQIGLPEATLEQLKQDIREIRIGDASAYFVNLIGPESATRRERIAGIVLQRGDQTWFFKIHGPADLVETQLNAFEEFVKSVQFGSTTGAN
jgi:hypothetical protein